MSCNHTGCSETAVGLFSGWRLCQNHLADAQAAAAAAERRWRRTPEGRWITMLERLEAAGLELVRYHQWYGVGSAYAEIGYADAERSETIILRISGHAQPPDGSWHGGRYGGIGGRELADVSIHPGSGVTARNVVARVRAALDAANRPA